MPIPTHSSDCGTRTFPCLCPDCYSAVFFLSCTCGSKVFFDQIGPPWPIHDCTPRQIRESIEFMKDIDHLTNDEVYSFIDTHGTTIPAEYIPVIERILGKRRFQFIVVPVDYSPSVTSITGRIMNINRNINFYKKSNTDAASIMAEKLLKELVVEPHHQITIREGANNTNQSRELKVYANQTFVKRFMLKQGDYVALEIRPANSLAFPCWICVSCQKL